MTGMDGRMMSGMSNWIFIGACVYALISIVLCFRVLDTYCDEYSSLDGFIVGLLSLCWPVFLAYSLLKGD